MIERTDARWPRKIVMTFRSTGMLLLVLRRLDDGFEISAERGRGYVRLRSPNRPWNDELLDLRCELADAGLAAATWVRTFNGDSIVAWAADLAESFRGWDGTRAWESLDHDLRIEVTHDGSGHVSFRFVVRGPRGYEPDAWEACVMVKLDAGEDMRHLVAALSDRRLVAIKARNQRLRAFDHGGRRDERQFARLGLRATLRELETPSACRTCLSS